MWPPPKKEAPPPPPPKPAPAPAPEPRAAAAAPSRSLAPIFTSVVILAMIAGWLYLRITASDHSGYNGDAHQLLQHLTVFVLSVFVGWQVIWNVTPALHTPLMSVTNAISGIIIVGGMLQHGSTDSAAVIIGAAATLLAAINVSGGFLVTQRMLKMFRK